MRINKYRHHQHHQLLCSPRLNCKLLGRFPHMTCCKNLKLFLLQDSSIEKVNCITHKFLKCVDIVKKEVPLIRFRLNEALP